MHKKRKVMGRGLDDTCVIYHSEEDGCFVAHSLRTDQIGTGDCVVAALADLMRAIEELLELAEKERDVAIYRDAPPEIRRMAKRAKPLPVELYEIAHKMVHGEWPKELAVNASPRKRGTFTARIKEPIPG